MTSVLITGFGRFPGAPFNPSGPVALALAKRRRPAFADLRRAAHIFETSYAAVDRDLPKLIARLKPDIVLMFGLAARTPFVRIETRARNAMSILFPDVRGHRPDERAIARGKPALCGRAPFRRVLGAARAARVPARASRANISATTSTGARWKRPDPERPSRSSFIFRRSRTPRAVPDASAASRMRRLSAPEKRSCLR